MIKDRLSEKGGDQKKALASGLEMEEEDLFRENDPAPKKKSKNYPSRNVRGKRKREDRSAKLGPEFGTKPCGHPDPVDSDPSTQTPSAKRSLFALESEQSQGKPRWDPAEGAPMRDLGGGFPNLGNTCYMNAVLQSLFAIPPFADDLLRQDFPWKKVPMGSLVALLSQLLLCKDILEVETKAVILLRIKNTISAVSEVFSGSLQNDAHEFLGQCLDQLKKEIEDLECTLWSAERETECKNWPAQATLCPVQENFEFELQASITCKACGQTTLKTEQSHHLSVNLCQTDPLFPVSVQGLLDLFFQEEDVERTCQECGSQDAALQFRLHQLPRVLVVHLKRYSLDDQWQMTKNSQEVQIPRYLNVTPYCTKDPRLPRPLPRPGADGHVLDAFQDGTSETLSSRPPVVPILATSGPLTVPVGPEEAAEQRPIQTDSRGGARPKQSRGQGSGSALEPLLRSCGSRVLSGERLPASASPMDEVAHEEENKLASIPYPHSPWVPENPEMQKASTLGEVEGYGLTELLEGLYDYKGKAILEGGQTRMDWLHQMDQKRVDKELPQPEPPRCIRQLDNLENTEKIPNGFSKLRLPKTDTISLGAWGSGKNPENEDVSQNESSAVEAKDPHAVQTGDPLQAYRLISVLSHLGDSQKSGHYISDVFDFERQAWFTYSDLKVFRVSEATMQVARLHCGYIFFYMHNEIFKALLGRQPAPSQWAHRQGDVSWDSGDYGDSRLCSPSLHRQNPGNPFQDEENKQPRMKTLPGRHPRMGGNPFSPASLELDRGT
ncbi:ubiquitin carboxyl-terminal hydrolase 29 [Thomomys bottae]